MANHSKTSGTVSFSLRKSNKETKSIILGYSYGRGNRFTYSVGYQVKESDWDKRRHQVKTTVSVRNHNEINKLIRDLETELYNTVVYLDSKQIPITNKLLKEALDKFTNKTTIKDEDKKLNLLSFIEGFLLQKEKTLKGGSKSQTLKSYKQTYNHLVNFSKETGFILEFDTIDNDFYASFIEYMNIKSHSRGVGYSLNTIGKMIKNFKTFMNASIDENLHSNLVFKKFKVLNEVTTEIYLTLDELRLMNDYDFSNNKHLELARDIFIIGCEIGQRIGDYSNLTKHEIVEYADARYFKIKQEKTLKVVHCRITKAIQSIMDVRYNGNVPQKITSQKLNKYIKQVGQIVGIDASIKVERTIGGVKKVSYIPKHKLIMGHTARRTFCTLKYKGGVNVHKIMELSGHSTVREFMKYIRNPKEERVYEITNSSEFINSSL